MKEYKVCHAIATRRDYPEQVKSGKMRLLVIIVLSA